MHVIGKQAECFDQLCMEMENHEKKYHRFSTINTEKTTNLWSPDVSDEKCKDSNGKRAKPASAGNLWFRHHRSDRKSSSLEGWIDIRGKLSPKKALIQQRDNQLCVEYAPGLYFYQKDIDEFIRTKIRRPHHGRKSCSVNPVLT